MRTGCLVWCNTKQTDPLHKRFLLDIHERFHLLIVFLSLTFNNLPLPNMPCGLHLLLIFKFKRVLMTAFEMKAETPLAFPAFLYGDIFLLKCVSFI
jgi:hypothetical protein